MQQVTLAVRPGVVRRGLARADHGQPGDQPVGVALVVLDERVQPVHRGVLLDGEECVLPMPSYLVVDHFSLKS